MKKLNKKGFAISTLIYGLSILGLLLITMLMSTLSNTRSNSKEMSNAIEEDLNRYSRTSIAFSSSTKAQEFVVPDGESGWYRIELWGAQGSNGAGGPGAYTTGIIELQEGESLYFYVGKKGAIGEGGEETSVRVESGTDDNSKSSRIMVAGGGGSKYTSPGTTISKYTATVDSKNFTINSDNTISLKNNLIGTTYSSVNSVGNEYPITYNNSINNKSGGKGYYNGKDETEGGTSFISGYAGSKAYSKGVPSGAKYTYYEYSYNTGFSNTASKSYYFYDGMMLDGVKSGDGLARIQRVVRKTDDTQVLPRQNKKMNGVRTIQDCTDNYAANTTSIILIKDGNIINPVSSSQSPDKKCITYNLSAPTDLDEIAVWHGAPGIDYKNHTIIVTNNEGTATLKGTGDAVSTSVTETPTGIHISAYQPDYTEKNVPTGDYYIFAVTSETKVLTTPLESDKASNGITFSELNGGNNQTWEINPIACKLYDSSVTQEDCARNNTGVPTPPAQTEYKIEDLLRFNALTILNDENKVNNIIGADNNFNDLTRNPPTIWQIISIKNNTFKIKSSAVMFSSTLKADGLVYDSNSERDRLMIAQDNAKEYARFYLYRLNF